MLSVLFVQRALVELIIIIIRDASSYLLQSRENKISAKEERTFIHANGEKISQRQLNLFFTLASIIFRSTPLPTSIMVAKLSKISENEGREMQSLWSTLPIWRNNGVVLVQDVVRYLAIIVSTVYNTCMNHRTLAGAFTT